MKTRINFLVMLVLAVMTTLTFTQCEKDQESQEMQNYALNQGFGNNGGGGIGINHGNAASAIDVCECFTTNFAPQDLNEAEIKALIFMREEEKLARDVYSLLYEKWNFPVFNNIRNSEERHMQTMLCLIERYGLEDPVGKNANGVFVDQELAGLYEALTAKTTASLVDALEVGATIEDVDIDDLVTLTESGEIDNEDILAAFADLTKGSRNHLRAFVRTMNRYGVDYTPKNITGEYYNQIINTERERGGSVCAGVVDCPHNGTGINGDCPGDGSGTCDQDCLGTGTRTGNGPGNGPGKGKKGGPN